MHLRSAKRVWLKSEKKRTGAKWSDPNSNPNPTPFRFFRFLVTPQKVLECDVPHGETSRPVTGQRCISQRGDSEGRRQRISVDCKYSLCSSEIQRPCITRPQVCRKLSTHADGSREVRFSPAFVCVSVCLFIRTISVQEAQLSQRNRATWYVSKFVLCFTRYGGYRPKCFNQQKWSSRSFKGLGNGAIR